MLMKLDGVNGQIELYSDKIIVKRKGVLSKITQGFTKGDKSIYLNQITGIQLKLGTNITNGYFQFTAPGGNEKEKGIFEATMDENSVVFRKKDNDTALKMKEKIESLRQGNQTKATQSGADEILKYKKLLDSGIITQEEFDKKKKEILGNG